MFSPVKEKGVILLFENRLNLVTKTRVESSLLVMRINGWSVEDEIQDPQVFVGSPIQYMFPSRNLHRFVQFRLLGSRSAHDKQICFLSSNLRDWSVITGRGEGGYKVGKSRV